MTTSFQKKTKGRLLKIPGTKPSLQNNQLIVSTGVPSLDSVLGGGVAVGTVLLIEEDTYGSYSKLLLKYFLAEGAVCKHHLLLGSADSRPENILKELPGVILDEPEQLSNSEKDSGDLKIAWRYQHTPQVSNNLGLNKYGHYYDLTKTLDPNIIENTEKTLHYVCERKQQQSNVMKSSYAELLKEIQETVDKYAFSTTTQSAGQTRNILRIGLHSLGSPLWGEKGGMPEKSSGSNPSLIRFLYALRALLRSSFAVCMITMPVQLFQELAFVRRLEHMCDTVVHLESFVGSSREKNPAFSEYHGLFNIIKLPRLNSLICHIPDTLDLAFKLKRKKFLIEKLHLPPELQDTASRNQEDPVLPILKIAGLGCASSSGNSTLDF